MEQEMTVEWLLEGLIPKGGYGIIAGPNGIGKSQLGLRLCEAIVEQTRFLNMWQCLKKDAVVMFLSLEMVAVELKEVLIAMKNYGGFFPTGQARCKIVATGRNLPLDSEKGRKALENLLAGQNIDLLVIDSLSLAMDGNFKDDAPVLEFNRAIRRLSIEFGVAIVVIHHNRKGQDKKYRYNELDDLYGSRFLSQDTSFVLMMDKPKTMKGDSVAINTAKMRFSKAMGEIHVDHTNMNFINAVAVESTESLMQNFEGPRVSKPSNTPDFNL